MTALSLTCTAYAQGIEPQGDIEPKRYVCYRTAGELTIDGKLDEPSWGMALRSVADCLKRSLDYAEEKGVMLALEDHPQMTAGDSPVELAERVKERVVHVHAKDRDQQLEDRVIGEGCVPFTEIFKILKSANFDGWISLEGGGAKGRQGIVEGMRYVRELWGNV